MSEKTAQQIRRIEEAMAWEARRQNQQDAIMLVLIEAAVSQILNLGSHAAVDAFLIHLNQRAGLKFRMGLDGRLVFGDDKPQIIH